MAEGLSIASKWSVQLKKYHKLIYSSIKKQIREETLCGKTILEYRVPEINIEISDYNLNTCLYFLIHKLRRKKYKVDFIKPNILIIHWDDPEVERQMELINSFLENEYMKSVLKYKLMNRNNKELKQITYHRLPKK
jgi:hypothetical protein